MMHALLAASFLLLLLHAPVQSFSGTATSRKVANENHNEYDLSTYFQDEFGSSSALLSSTNIVEMIRSPTEQSQRPGTSFDVPSPNTDRKLLRQEIFSSPIISLLYERLLPPLWAAGLRIGGPEAEYDNAMAFLRPQSLSSSSSRSAEEGRSRGVALDLSCGTGFVGIRMAKSKEFKHVFALDYSRQMLNECLASARREESNRSTNLPLSIIRGDAGNLPFRDCSIDAVHWGAAMHCVPNAEQAMSEVYRILKPGGRLYATTFLRPFPDVVFRFFDLEELNAIAKGAGFGGGLNNGSTLDVKAERRLYGVTRATKG